MRGRKALKLGGDQMTVKARKHRFTVGEYHQLSQAGILSENKRVELIEGEIIEMVPIGSKHAACVNRLNQLFFNKAGQQTVVSVQNPIRLDKHSEPQPDLALLKPCPDFYADEHPGPQDVLLVVEVAETSQEYDREVKLPLYARAGIPEVWLVDLKEEVVVSYREPGKETYGEVQQYEGETEKKLTLSSIEKLEIKMEEILP